MKRQLVRSLSHSARATATARAVAFPHLKDKAPVVTAFHRDKRLPFNVLRDVLRFPQMEQNTLDSLQHAWLLFVTVNDMRDLQRLVTRHKDHTEIWKASIRLANASPMIMNGLLNLWKDESMRLKMQMLADTPEILIGSLIYHQKYETALTVFQRHLKDKSQINWVPIIDVCIALDSVEGMKTLSKIYQECTKKEVYSEVLAHLRQLNLREPYINKWNNVLVSQGDFPRNSSLSLEQEFESMLSTGNFRSLKNCLKNLGPHEKQPGWLKPSTTKILSKYISQSKPQTETFFETLRSCGGAKNFPVSFWSDLYTHTSIPTAVLDHRLKEAGIALDHIEIASSRLKSLSNKDMEHFWKIVSAESRQTVLSKSSLSILSVAIKSSTVEKSFDYCLHLLSLHPSLKDSICRVFIVEMSKKIRDEKIRTDVLTRLETFLQDNGMTTDKVNNLFIYSELLLSKYHSAITRLDHLLSKPGFVLEDKTVDNVLKFLTRSQQDVEPHMKLFDDNVSFRILDLTLKCLNHCPELSYRTWRRILNMIGRDYDMDHISNFFVGVVDRLNREEAHFHSSNPSHPLRQVFDEQLLKKILEWGFVKTPENPWSGFELIKQLQKSGVYVPENLLKKHLVRLTKVLHDYPGASASKRLRGGHKSVPQDVSTTMRKLNEIHEGHFLTL